MVAVVTAPHWDVNLSTRPFGVTKLEDPFVPPNELGALDAEVGQEPAEDAARHCRSDVPRYSRISVSLAGNREPPFYDPRRDPHSAYLVPDEILLRHA